MNIAILHISHFLVFLSKPIIQFLPKVSRVPTPESWLSGLTNLLIVVLRKGNLNANVDSDLLRGRLRLSRGFGLGSPFQVRNAL